MACQACSSLYSRTSVAASGVTASQHRSYRIFSGGASAQKHAQSPSLPSSTPTSPVQADRRRKVKRPPPRFEGDQLSSKVSNLSEPPVVDETPPPKKHVPRFQRDQANRTYFPKARIDTATWQPSSSSNVWSTGSTPLTPRPSRVQPTSLDRAKAYMRELRGSGRYIAPPTMEALEEIRQLREKDPERYSSSRLAKLYGLPQPVMLIWLDRLKRQTVGQLRQSREAEVREWEAMPVEVRAKAERRAKARESIGLLEVLEARRARGEELVPSEETGAGAEVPLEREKQDDPPRQRPDWLQKRFAEFEQETARSSKRR